MRLDLIDEFRLEPHPYRTEPHLFGLAPITRPSLHLTGEGRDRRRTQGRPTRDRNDCQRA
jgi:hypothetical protein